MLIYLKENPEASRTDLRKNLNASIDAIYSTLPIMMNLGLIEEKTLDEFPFSVVISLTEKGRIVAEHLVEIERLLSEYP